MKRLFNFLLSFMLVLCSTTDANDELLKSKDINRIMQQIFSQHVDKKEISSAILKNTFQVYIDQFDPERIYLLESEVKPYKNLSESELNKIVQEYKNENYQSFEKLNALIQKAILRAREMRKEIEENKNLLFSAPGAVKKTAYGEWSDPDLKKPFPSSKAALEANMTNHLLDYIQAEKRHFGEEKVIHFQDETLQIYNKHLENYENQYLFLSDSGKSMTPEQKENVFTLHVLKALASSLDAHTSVLNPSEAYDMRIRLEKGFQGIGIGLKQKSDGTLEITRIIDGGPAEKSQKLQSGDQILKVNGTAVTNLPLNSIMEMLRGIAGSSIKLQIKRPGQRGGNDQQFDIDLKREEISINENRAAMTYEPYQNGVIGKITLHSFYQGAAGVNSENDVQKAIQELAKKGPIKGLILDMRENSGGFLTQAVKVAGLFISNGVVVVSKYANGEEHFYRDMNNKVSYDGPLIILTSKATASAAEIVAQALQDYGVALIVGDEHTYGKGTIQSQTVTDNKSTSYFKVTVGKYYTVSGKTPQMQGVKADIIVPSPFTDEHIGEEYLEYSLKPDTIPSSFDDNLTDIDPNLRSWYMHYYMPSLQHQTNKWRSMLATLKVNNVNRLNKNELYKKFLEAEHHPSADSDKVRKKYWVEDVQMQEAVDIIKDMIALQSKESSVGTPESRNIGNSNNIGK